MAAAAVDVTGMNTTIMGKTLKLSSWEPLRKVAGRESCEVCGKSRKFFCYTCYKLTNLVKDDIPEVPIPVKVDIIKHQLESNSKSTSSHAKLLSPNVNIFDFPEVPSYSDSSKIILAYPSKNSICTEQLVKGFRDSGTYDGWNSLDAIVFIDSTWSQTAQILKDPALSKLTTVKLSKYETSYWRPQKETSNHLSTIESVYYLLTELEMVFSKWPDQNRFDNLLFFYLYQHGIVDEVRHGIVDEARQQQKIM